MSKTVSLSELIPIIKDTLQNGGKVIIGISGNSMEPLLRHKRDKVCIVGANESELKKYDIALYVRHDGTYVIHRIIGIKNNAFVMAGDRQLSKEYPVIRTQIFGVVKSFWRNGKHISCNNFIYKAYCRIWAIRLLFREKQL